MLAKDFRVEIRLFVLQVIIFLTKVPSFCFYFCFREIKFLIVYLFVITITLGLLNWHSKL